MKPITNERYEDVTIGDLLFLVNKITGCVIIFKKTSEVLFYKVQDEHRATTVDRININPHQEIINSINGSYHIFIQRETIVRLKERLMA